MPPVRVAAATVAWPLFVGKSIMKASEVTVATIVWARSADEVVLIGRALDLLSQAGMRIAIADRGTNVSLTEALRSLPHVTLTVPPEHGLVEQVRASLELAGRQGTRFLLYTEPDKEDFFRRWLTDFINRSPSTPDVGVVLASRSEKSFQTYPATQRRTEALLNDLCGERLGAPGDYSYGPLLINRVLLPYIALLRSELGWGWRHAIVARAHRLGLRVHHVDGDYACPEGQRHEGDGERKHRLRQLSQNLLGLID
jgi:hypothetical protein